MKKLILLVVMVVLLVALMAGSAFATRYDSGYAPFAGSPHGQYSTATTKCAACHAVHNPGGLGALGVNDPNKLNDAARNAAMGTSEVLLRSSVANACTYCHLSNPAFGIKMVYNGAAVNYTTASGFGHTSNGASMSNLGVNCVDCHQVHGAASLMANSGDAYMYRKILKAQPGYDANAPAFAANASTITPVAANITRWCTGCHNYYEAGYNSNSHVMTSAKASYANGSANISSRVAWSASTDCRSCHQDGVTNAAAATGGVNNYPHFTGGYRFLRQANGATDTIVPATAPTGSNTNDGTCLICHASGTNGAGQTF
jgi:cytochrome c553